MILHRHLLFLLVLGLCSCGPGAQFKSAQKDHAKGRHYKAWKKYQALVADHPAHALAPAALFYAGLISQQNLGDCFMAKTFYDNLLGAYPQSSPWAKAALIQKNSCPDYFPLVAGTSWIEGDSETKGDTARVETICAPFSEKAGFLPGENAQLTRSYFAGRSKFKVTEYRYEKKNSELWEFPNRSDPTYKIIMRWPLEPGTTWTTKFGGQMFRYEVIENDAVVSVQAGEYKNCVKIRFSVVGTASSTYEYYAPGIGRVLTTLGSTAGERRNTELLSFTKGPDPLFDQWMPKK